MEHRAEFENQRPLGIYVHIPYCVHRCSYCDFYSTVRYERDDFIRVVERVKQEIEAASGWWRSADRSPKPITSIFFGGGTPSLLPPSLIESVLQKIDLSFGIDPGAELTIEANPETVTPEFADELMRGTRIRRVSLGVQSFQTEFLELLERRVTPEAVRAAFRSLRAAGFDNLSLDLIFGIPGQDICRLDKDLNAAFELVPRHLSFYNLTLKPGHPLHSRLPDSDYCADLYSHGVERLAAEGYDRYEISNFARAGFESRHNGLYWDGGEFFGVGPSAATRLFASDGTSLHRKQISDTARYLRDPKAMEFEFECSSPSQTVLEAAFLELRKTAGVDLERFKSRYDYDLLQASKLPLYEREGLLVRQGNTLRLSSRGLMLADTLSAELVELS